MKKFRVALLQIAPEGRLSENLKKGEKYCRMAKEKDVDIALFPEMYSNGYNIYNRPVEDWKAEAIDSDSDFVIELGRLANKLNLAIGITFLERYNDSPRNAMTLFDRFGERKFMYAKVHTCDFDVERNQHSNKIFFDFHHIDQLNLFLELTIYILFLHFQLCILNLNY